MGIRIIRDEEHDQAVLYCSTTMVAFGPVIGAFDNYTADEVAEAFVKYMKTANTWDMRSLNSDTLSHHYYEFTRKLLSDKAKGVNTIDPDEDS